jgi:hypothetical protein
MTLNLSQKCIPLADITLLLHYGTPSFVPAPTQFIALFNNPTISHRRELDEHAQSVHLPFTTLPVFHRVKFRDEELGGNDTVDLIHVQPPVYSNTGVVVTPARFDTVLVNVQNIISPSKQLHSNSLSSHGDSNSG